MNSVIDIGQYMLNMGKAARSASAGIRRASTGEKNSALLAIGDEILASREVLMRENEKDLLAGKAAGLDEPMLDRLAFSNSGFSTMVDGLAQVVKLPDPVGEISNLAFRPNGLQIGKMRTPIGVIGIIFESRPNVTIDAASLCLKSGNAVILRGGSEAIHSNRALATCIAKGIERSGLPQQVVQLVAHTDRAAVGELITMDQFVDVIIPRGGASLIERVSADATIPVIKHLDGVCHVYIDDDADRDKALAIAINAKTQRYAVCNAMETLLVAKSRAAELLPELARQYCALDVALRGCPATCEVLNDICAIEPATDDDWHAEYLGPILSIKIVAGLDTAINHINTYGSNHTDSIVTENYSKSRRFIQEVDSSSVLINASTRFSDGFEYGLGAEIGISTNKLHARGPVGLEGLTSEKYVVFGDGQIRQ